eukprot:TRINITY_DN7384_c0_g1_i1.p1 TRINITY_DN7384_c0_g1~~TRINITY_DN7384_c0_g1_i1.p1  ORF type:complete len:356 (+),score=59.10 TRINITY_DN7384_c0_g1_i1:74-1141(+)
MASSSSPWTSFKGFVYSRQGAPSEVLEEVTCSLPPKIAGDTVYVRVAYASLNPLDWKLMRHLPSWLIRKPILPCVDFSGTVVALGPDVSDFKVGDKVYGRIGDVTLESGTKSGALAEYAGTKASSIYKIPRTLTLEQAGGLASAAATSYAALVTSGQLRPGQSVFINGSTGGVGMHAIQIARNLVGKEGSVVVSCSEPSIPRVKQLGADTAYDYKSPSFMDSLSRHKFDVVMDNVGDHSFYYACPSFTKADARFVNIAGDIGPLTHMLGSFTRMAGHFLLPSILGGTPRKYSFGLCKWTRECYAQTEQWVNAGQLSPVVDSVHPFSPAGIRAAFAVMESGRAKGKVHIKVDDGAM